MRNTFDPGLFENSRASLTITRPHSADVNELPSQLSIPLEDDMGHLSRRIYMGRDVSLCQVEEVQAQSFGSRIVLNSIRCAGAEGIGNKIEGNASTVSHGPTIVSPYMVSRFIAELIKELMLEDHRLRWSSQPTPWVVKNEYRSSPIITPSSYDFLTRPGYRSASSVSEIEVPTLEDIVEFFYKICTDSQMEYECAIISLIYIERVIQMSNGMFTLNANNWKGLVLAAMLLSSKVSRGKESLCRIDALVCLL